MPGAYVQTSSIRPVVGEFDRTFTVVLNAYTGPVIRRYLSQLRRRLRGIGYDGDVLITQMNGGVRTIERTIEELPGYTIQSGPTAGLLGAEAYAREVVEEKNFLCVDIGGTSTDIGLVVEAQALTIDDWGLEFGIRLGFPALDVRSIGAGGDSLIQLDELGTLRIGPESAGSDPGPAYYGRGGVQMELSRDAAVTALEAVAAPLKMSALELASGAYRLMNAQIEQETSKIIFERAVDPSNLALPAYGGAGSAHAANIARLAGIGRVVVPYFPGGFSALGMVVAPIRSKNAVSVVAEIDALGPERLQEIFDSLEADIIESLSAQGLKPDDVIIERALHGHYVGQGFANRVLFPTDAVTPQTIEKWKQDFHVFYDKSYGYSAPESPIEVTTMTVGGCGRPGRMPVTRIAEGGGEPEAAALVMTDQVCLDGLTWQEIPVYRRAALKSGNRIVGPAVIDDGLSTILVVEDSEASVDPCGNVMIDLR
ncbi:hydantoinase/oxoprolinase family protein [Rhodococcus opacus]|uniref:hydantoinase/oxoprolinase family protein n=1 Tax=Rhodococcus opacus TaxID=37919 RepID=UPI00211EE817|nr:hydantoinase/oxoprolinase family protein [Rhodococcus opacus]